MPLNESDTRVKLTDPALHSRGWTEDIIRRIETTYLPTAQVALYKPPSL